MPQITVVVMSYDVMLLGPSPVSAATGLSWEAAVHTGTGLARANRQVFLVRSGTQMLCAELSADGSIRLIGL